MMMNEIKISAVIITFNEEQWIGKCLDALRGVADEIIVVDSFSSDNTAKICRKNPNVFFVQREWKGFSSAKNFGNSLANHPYILSLDADEVLSDELKGSILEEKLWLRGAYTFCRRNHIGNRVVRFCGWYPDKKIRLFPKDKAHWNGDFVHETIETKEPIFHLKGDLLHYSYQSLNDLENRFKKYAELGSIALFKEKKKISKFNMALKVVFKFLSIFFLKLGFLDGYYGYKIALEAAKAQFFKYKKLKALYEVQENPAAITPQYSKPNLVKKIDALYD